MVYDTDKIDYVTLALLALVMHERDEYGARAWKGFDWDTLERLHKKGFLQNPKGKSKSVVLTPEGVERAEKLFDKFLEIKEERGRS